VTVKKAGTIKLTAKSNGKSAESTITVAQYSTSRWTAGETRYKNGSGGDPPCTDCHVNGKAIDHSPAALATATDEKIAVVITTGISTSGFPIKIDNQPGHKWNVTDEERDGLVTYLRSLEPRGFK
jgi:mono/diheme cytochrome c family protein